MKKVFIVWAVFLILIFTMLTAFGFFYKNKISNYRKLEEKIVDAEKKYVDAKFLYPTEGNRLLTDSTELIENGFLDHLQNGNETCDGYAEVTMKGKVYQYKGYIKCEKYKTKNYKK